MKTFIYVLLLLSLPISYILPQEEEEEEGTPMMINGVLACGVERWAVKTCIDADTVNINFNNIVPSSIAYQRSLVHPTLPSDNTTRLAVEDTVYQITCQLVEYKYETDQDYHVVIKTIGSASETMVSEIPDPTCAGISNTSRYQELIALRTWFSNRYSPTSIFKSVGDTVTLTGVGFFDFAHGQTGAAPNQREIHPILTMSLYKPQSTLTLTALIQGLYNESTMTPDTITVELHSASSPYALIESNKGILNSAGTGTFNFNNAINGTPYYIVVKHRNGLETWSATGNSFSASALSYDMTSLQSQAYGNNLIQKGSKWCIYSGDITHDGLIDLSDMVVVDNDNSSAVSGYSVSDLNGDGIVDLSDLVIIDNNNANAVSKAVPGI
ncbi:MAG: hypothetical protein P4L27_04005 [Ignavibacteriaceae bacterium]|nr:hypothetical protein [Ignavibacteriaceae bacterium]